MQKEPIAPAAWQAEFPFSPAIRSGDFVFVSGQASTDAEGQIVAGSFEEEMRRSLDNLREVLAAAGCGLEDVVQIRAYVDASADVPEFNSLYREYFEAPLPARTTLVDCLGGVVKFEVDAVAHRSPSAQPR